MHRASRLFPVLLLLLVLGGCAKSKLNETLPPDPSASASAVTPTGQGRSPAPLLCNDGLHRRGDHWKIDCNPCRCAADGDIVCAQFPCIAADAGTRDAAAR